MSKGFNLTAQINLQGPANIKPVVAKIKREIGTISTNLDIKFDSKASKNVQNLTGRLSELNSKLIETNTNSKSLTTTLASLSNAFSGLGSTSKTFSGLEKTTKTVTSTAKAVKVASSEIEEFGKQSALAIRRFAAFSVVTSGVFALINSIRTGTQAFIAFNQEIIKVRQITGLGSVGIKDLENTITSLAVTLGVSSEKLAEISLILSQAGLSASETKAALSALAKTELAPTFENLNKTAEGGIAAIRQFGLEANELEKALGSVNAVAASFAVESGDIIAAIQRAGGAFAASSKGVSEGLDALNEFIAVFTSVRATTRESAETIATGLRTIFTRIQRGSTIKFLREFGVELTDAEGKFVGTFNAVQRLSEVLNTLDPRDIRFSKIIEELGGFRQVGKVIPLIQQFGEAQKALAVAQGGQDSLTQNLAVAQLSLANQIARVREEFLSLVRAIGDSSSFQFLFKTILGITSGLIKLTSAFKPILPLLGILAGVKGLSAVTQFIGGFAGGIKKTSVGSSDASSPLLPSLSADSSKTGTSESTSRATDALLNNTDSIKALTTSVDSLTQVINSKLGSDGSTTLNQGGRVLAFKKGGSVPGSGRGDKVKALLEPNEYVMSRKAVSRIGKDNLEKMNRGGSIIVDYSRKKPEPGLESEIIDNNLLNSVNQLSSYFNPTSNKSRTARNITNYRSIIGNVFQSALELAGTGRLVQSDQSRSFDFPSGLKGGAASLFNKLGDSAIPVDAKKSDNSLSSKMLNKVNQFYTENPSSNQTNFGAAVYETGSSGDISLDIDDTQRPWKAIKKYLGGTIQKFRRGSPGGVDWKSLSKGRGSSGARGARSKYDFLGIEEYQRWSKPIYDEYYSDPSLTWSSFLGIPMPPEIALYHKMVEDEVFTRGGAGLAVGKKFVRTPSENITDELRPYLEVDPSDPSQLGYYKEVIARFAKQKAVSAAQTAKLGKESALQAREAQLKSYTDAEGAISNFRTTGQLDIDPDIMNYIKNSIANPDSLSSSLASKDLSKLKAKLTKPNVEAFNKLVGPDRIPVDVQGQRTKLAEVFGSIIETYGSDVGMLEIDSIIGAIGSKIPGKNSGGAIRSFARGGANNPIGLDEAKALNASTIIPGLGGADIADQIVRDYWSTDIPPDPTKSAKTIEKLKSLGLDNRPKASQVLDKSKIGEWSRKYKGTEFLEKILEAREAVYDAYVKKINADRAGSSILNTQQVAEAQQSGLLFGVAGMYGNPFPPRSLKLVPGAGKDAAINKLKGPVDVNLVGAVLDKNDIQKQVRLNAQAQASSDRLLDIQLAPTRDELSEKFGEKSSLYAIKNANKDRAIQYVNAIAKSLDPSSGGSQIFLDFDKTLAFGADKITKRGADGKPDYSSFSDPNEVSRGLSTANLSKLGTRLKSLVEESNSAQPGLGSELLKRMFVVTARPDETTGLIANWLQEKGLPIPSSNFVGVGGSGKSPNDVAMAKAEQILARLSGDRSVFIDDDLKNVDVARTKGLRAVQYGANIDKKARKDAQDREGTLFEKFVRENLPPNLVRAMISQRGESIDYPSGLGSIASDWFNEPLLTDIPTDVKRTVAGASKVQSNIANFLRKNFGYAFGGRADGPSFDEIRQQIIDKYPEIEWGIRKRKSGFGYNLMGALKSSGGIFGKDSLNFQQPTNLKQLQEFADKLALQLGVPEKLASGGRSGSVPAMVSNGESYVPPQLAKRIGYAKLDRLNQADRNGISGFASGGISKFKGPGSGTSDSIGPINLPVGSYILREKATKALGFNKGGSVGIKKFASGSTGGVRGQITEDRRLAEIFKQVASDLKAGLSDIDSLDRAVENARKAFPEAVKPLQEAADKWKAGVSPSEIFKDFGGDLSRLAPDAFASGGLLDDKFNALAKIVTRSADTLEYFSAEADNSLTSLESFQKGLKKQLADKTLERESSRRSTRSQLTRDILKGGITDLTDIGNISNLTENLTASLTSLTGSLADSDQIDASVQAIIEGVKAGEGLSELRSRIELLGIAFDENIDRATALAEVESEATEALGNLTTSVRNTVDEIGSIEYVKSGRARKEFGVGGELNPAAALAFKRTLTGRVISGGIESFQESLFLNKLPLIGKSIGNFGKVLNNLPGPIGNAVRAIGGMPGALAAVASVIGSEFLPKLNQALNLGTNARAAGIAGAVAQAGSFGVSLGTIGKQIGGDLGAVVGTITGAVAGAIIGFTEAFRKQELANALRNITESSEKAAKALSNLSKYDSPENALQALQTLKDQSDIITNLKDLSERTSQEKRSDALGFGSAGLAGGLIAATGLFLTPFTAGLSLAVSSAIVAGLATVGTALGAAYGYNRGFTDLDNEALDSVFKNISEVYNGFSQLAEREIKFKSLDQLEEIINGFGDTVDSIDFKNLGLQSEYIQKFQEAALRQAGFTIDPLANFEEQIAKLDPSARTLANNAAQIAAYDAGLEQLSRRLGGDKKAIREATASEEQRQKIADEGLVRLGQERRQLALQQRLTLISKQLNIETESLVFIFQRALSSIQRFNDTLQQTDFTIATSTDILANQTQLSKVDRTNQQTLKNIRAFSIKELEPIFKQVFDLAGADERASQLVDSLKAKKIVDDTLPEILRTAGPRDVRDVTGTISDVFSGAGLGERVTDALVKEIENVLGQSVASRQGKSFEELLRDFPQLQQSFQILERANETAVALLEAQNNLYDKIIDRLNSYSSALQKASEWSIKSAQIRLSAENDLAKSLGFNISLEKLNRVFDEQIKSLTEDLDLNLPPTTDPSIISNRIRKNQEEFIKNQRDIALQPSTKEGRQKVLDLLKEQEKLKRSSSNLQKALETLATSGDRASNALTKLQERRQIGQNASDLLEKVFTQGAEEADKMFRSFGALQDALSGRLIFGNQNERVLAFEGLKTLMPLLSNEIGSQLRAGLLERFLQSINVNLKDTLIPAIGGQEAFTFQNILDIMRRPEEDPATKALIDSFLTANDVMSNAAIEISKLNQEAATEFRRAAENLLSISFPDLVNDDMAKDVRDIRNAGLARGSLYTHDINVENLLTKILANNSIVSSGPLDGANNLPNINFPVFERISNSLPTLNTELLNLVRGLNNFNLNLEELARTIANNAEAGVSIDVDALNNIFRNFNADIANFANAARDFGSYISRLEKVKFPERITMGGSYTLDVRVSGAAAFQSLEEKTKRLIEAEISSKLDELADKIARSTGFRVDPRRRQP